MARSGRPIKHLIGGEQLEGCEVFETLNPANQDVLAEVAAGGEAEVAASVAAAKAAYPDGASRG
jgi:5-carboxymethyl-2-hydroxymuconic-semialdehyde dehydrogenase